MKISLSALILTPLIALSGAISAEPLSAARYVQIEMAARQAALDGAKSRLEQLGVSATAPGNDLSERTQAAITRVYRESGISPGAALAWENRHRKAIRDWLDAHPEIRQRYQDLNAELNDLSGLIDAVQGQ